ncbi:unnamed protein product, partial [Sphacelaria rigidula]
GGGGDHHPDDRGRGHSARHGVWRHGGRLTPPQPPVGSATDRRGWGSVDLASPPERGLPPPAIGTLPSIFERATHLARPEGMLLPPAASAPVSGSTGGSSSLGRLPSVGDGGQQAVGISGSG